MSCKGSWIKSAKNINYNGNILKCELRNLNGNWIKNELIFSSEYEYHNINDRFKISNIIPKQIFQTHKSLEYINYSEYNIIVNIIL